MGQFATISLPIERLRELLDYDPASGIFRWRVNRNRARAGAVAGCMSKRYVGIGIDGHTFLAHRLAWAWMTGEWPRIDVDHRNLIKTDNRWANLRLGGACGNMQNKAIYRNNTSGFKGVSFHKASQRWRAVIKANRQVVQLGGFDTAAEAGAAYAEAAARLHGEFARAA